MNDQKPEVPEHYCITSVGFNPEWFYAATEPHQRFRSDDDAARAAIDHRRRVVASATPEIQAELLEEVAALKALLREAGDYIRSAAVFEPDEADAVGDEDGPVGHELADRIFDALGIDRSGPEHAHVRDED